MNKNVMTLKLLLLAGAADCLAISIVHMLGTRVPLLYIYYDVPSYGYQDRVISFLSFGWSVFLFTTSRDPLKNRGAVKAVLIAGLGAIFGLTVINNVTDFHALSPEIDPSVFQMETLVLSAYVASLIFYYFLATKQDAKSG
jgi:hypothetical protein